MQNVQIFPKESLDTDHKSQIMLQDLLRTKFFTVLQFRENSTAVLPTSQGFLVEKTETYKKSTNPDFNTDSKERSPLILHFTLPNVEGVKNGITEFATFIIPEHLFFVNNSNHKCANEVVSDECNKLNGNRKWVYNSNVTRSALC